MLKEQSARLNKDADKAVLISQEFFSTVLKFDFLWSVHFDERTLNGKIDNWNIFLRGVYISDPEHS